MLLSKINREAKPSPHVVVKYFDMNGKLALLAKVKRIAQEGYILINEVAIVFRLCFF